MPIAKRTKSKKQLTPEQKVSRTITGIGKKTKTNLKKAALKKFYKSCEYGLIGYLNDIAYSETKRSHHKDVKEFILAAYNIDEDNEHKIIENLHIFANIVIEIIGTTPIETSENEALKMLIEQNQKDLQRLSKYNKNQQEESTNPLNKKEYEEDEYEEEYEDEDEYEDEYEEEEEDEEEYEEEEEVKPTSKRKRPPVTAK